ncbi:glycosyltransferase [Variovorax gossypii]|uniref:Glycosyltransferase n=2 Tax=Variovorax gossypii TaxID=1679495 RepID=A0A431TPM3_9BURK|nr:glycosyltransferase [Variovorax gossypii]
MSSTRIAVVIPSYKVTRHIASLIASIPSYVWRIYVVDDACPDQSGNFVKANCTDPRIAIVFHEVNQGVGGAVMTGYRAAIKDGAQVIVKIDGDGQMDPALIPNFVDPILSGEADYTKGNRFFDLEKVRTMPKVRLVGNAVLSLMTKLSSGYWDLFDPTNGYTAIHARVAEHLPMEKLSRRYFFETDVLFRLNTLRAVVMDVPMEAQYGDEVSNLKISKIVTEFLFKHARNFMKRIGYNYYLRDMSLGSLELPVGLLLFCGGGVFGIYQWTNSMRAGVETSSGTVMLAALPILMGIQLILSFFGQDIAAVPRTPLHKKISRRAL